MNLMPESGQSLLIAYKANKTPFYLAWTSLQKSQISNISTSSLHQKLEKCISQPSSNLGENLRLIVSLTHRIGERNALGDPEEGRISSIANCKASIMRYLANFYPFNLSSIEMEYLDVKRRNFLDPSTPFDPIATLIEIACDRLLHIAPQSKNGPKVETKNIEVQSKKISSSEKSQKYKKTIKCFLCGIENHVVRECRKFPQDKRFDKNFTCQMCQGHHLAKPCYRQMNINLTSGPKRQNPPVMRNFQQGQAMGNSQSLPQNSNDSQRQGQN
jgi:transcription elongation factor Elf1